MHAPSRVLAQRLQLARQALVLRLVLHDEPAVAGPPEIVGEAEEGEGRQQPPDLLRRLYTAVYAQTSEKSVRRWLAAGVLPFHRLGRQIRIAEADLLAFIAARRQQ